MKKLLTLMTVLFFLSASNVYSQMCNGDFDCDGDVDGTDAINFKLDFFRKDCPNCCPPESIWRIFQDGTGQSVLWENHGPNQRYAIYDVNNDNDGGPDFYFDDLVLDKTTGLVWTRNSRVVDEKTWLEAIDFCRTTTVLGNLGGWRLPTIEEIGSLVDLTHNPPFPSGNPFITSPGVTDNAWTSTTYEGDSSKALTAGPSGGPTDKTAIGYVWPVRGGNEYATRSW